MIILASKSPRRKELLQYITKDFEIKSADVDETLPDGMMPHDAVLRLSYIKAQPLVNDNDIVIGADTVVAIDNLILGKPKDEAEAYAMLRLLSGRVHSVYTGVSVLSKNKNMSFYVETKVKFLKLTDEDISKYIATGEPFDKAGAYGIQGYGSLLVEEIEGDYFNVVGLPVSKLNQILKAF